VLAILVALAAAGHQGTAQSVVVSYPAGWAVVGGPEGSILRGAVDRIYTLRPGDTDYRTFSASSPLRAGWGYWAFFPDGGSIDLAPGLFTYTITPDPGQWLMVGNPSSFALATITGATVQTEQLLGVGRGAFVMANGAVTVSVPPLGRVPPGEQIVAPTALPTPRITGQSQPTARCSDGSFDYSGAINACVANGGVAYWIPGLPEECVASTCATPAATPRPIATRTATPTATPTAAPTAVAPPLPAGIKPPLSLDVTTNDQTCRTSPLQVTATLTDSNDNPVPGALIEVAPRQESGPNLPALSFQPTDNNGKSRGSFTFRPTSQLSDVVVVARIGDQVASNFALCFAP